MPQPHRVRSLALIVERNTSGPRTVYTPELPKQVYELCLLGATDKELAVILGVGTTTINTWAVKYPEFGAAVALGGVRADAKVAAAMFQRATGYEYVEMMPVKLKVGQYEEKLEMVEVVRHVPADPTAGKFWLVNRQKGVWQEASKIDVSVLDNTGQKPVDEMSNEELFAVIDQATKSVQVSNNVIDVADIEREMKEMGFD